MKYFKNIEKFVLIFCLLFFSTIEAKASDAFSAPQIPITITEESGSDLFDYQILVKLNENNFYFESDIDGQNLEFYDEEDKLLNYWVEKWDASGEEARIWVKIPELKANETKTIYMDLSENDLPSGEDTFVFFDDFDNLDKWTKTAEGMSDAAVSNGILSMYRDSSHELAIKTNVAFSPKFIFETKVRPVNNNVVKHWFGWSSKQYATEVDFAVERNRYMSGKRFMMGTGLNYTYLGAPSYNWQINKVAIDATGKNVRYAWYQDDTLVTNYYATTKNYSGDENILQIQSSGGGQNGSGYFYVDWVRVRAYASPEPKVILPGTEPGDIPPEDASPVIDDTIVPNDNIIITKNDATALAPQTKIILLVFFLLAILICCLIILAAKSAGEKNAAAETKKCLQCGTVLDKNLPKCPTCGSGNFI